VLDTVRRLGGPFKIIESPRRAGDPPSLTARADRVKEVLGWQPRYNSLDTIVQTSMAWEHKLAQRGS